MEKIILKINIIYHHFPHYRAPVMRELVKSGVHEYRFWGAHKVHQGIEVFTGDELVKVNPIKFHARGGVWIIKGYWSAVFDKSADVLIVHGHPKMPASWFIGIVGRLTGKKILYWAHGWLKKETWLKSKIRNLHHRLAHITMTYAERAQDVAEASGFPRNKIVPIYNSLDWLAAKPILTSLKKEGQINVRKRLSIPSKTFRIICVARLTQKSRFDILIDAMADTRFVGKEFEICLIGEGDQKSALEKQAKDLGVNVSFLGAVYEEQRLGEQIFASNLTVSPGKVGLSAMHSMMYGIPVISHNKLDNQMPEVEAIVEGVTGSLFDENSAKDLAKKIDYWMNPKIDWQKTSAECVKMIETKYNPITQAKLINETISSLLENNI